jgi:hypothetical protein
MEWNEFRNPDFLANITDAQWTPERRPRHEVEPHACDPRTPESSGDMARQHVPDWEELDREIKAYNYEAMGQAFLVERCDPHRTEAGRRILEQPADVQLRYVERLVQRLAKPTVGYDIDAQRVLLVYLMKRKLAWNEPLLVRLLRTLAAHRGKFVWPLPTSGVLSVVERHLKSHGLSDDLRDAMEDLRRLYHVRAIDFDSRQLLARIERILRLHRSGEVFSFATQEAWTRFLATALAARDPSLQEAWRGLLEHAETAVQSKVSQRWQRIATEWLQRVGAEEFVEILRGTIDQLGQPGADQPRYHYEGRRDDVTKVRETHSDLLRGLVWMLGLVSDDDVAELLGRVLAVSAETCSQQPRSMKIAVAAIVALQRQATPQAVGILQQSISCLHQRSLQQRAEQALATLAKSQNLTPRHFFDPPSDEGLQELGCYRETIGRYTAECRIDSTGSVTCHWLHPEKPTQATPPKIVKSCHGDELVRLQKQSERLRQSLQKNRFLIERLYLRPHTFTWDELQHGFLEHRLLGPLARCLIWQAVDEPNRGSFIWHDDHYVDATGTNQAPARLASQFRLWHPLHATADEVVAWQAWVESQRLCQPFAQAHRTVYRPLTTDEGPITCDQRFTKHLVTGRRLSQLVVARHWTSDEDHRVAMTFQPIRELPAYGQRVLWQVFPPNANPYPYPPEHPQGDRRPKPNTGAVLFQSLDGSAPADARDLPPVVFSEALRDIECHFAQYASEWFFRYTRPDQNWILTDDDTSPAIGELSRTGRMRRDLIARLVPSSDLAPQCRMLEDRIEVTGKHGVYQVHFNSGFFRHLPDPFWHRGMLTPFSEKSLGLVPNILDFQLPFAGDLRLADIAETVYWLAHDDNIRRSCLAQTVERLRKQSV